MLYFMRKINGYIIGAGLIAAAAGVSPAFAQGAILEKLNIGGGSVPCPPVGFVPDAESITFFTGGSAPDAGAATAGESAAAPEKNMVFGATFKTIDGGCQLKDGFMNMEITVSVQAQTGLAGRDVFNSEAPYFVAALDNSGNILQKQPFSIKLSFGDSGIAFAQDTVRLKLPQSFAEGAGQVAVGFQVTEEQLRFNRSRTRIPHAQ